MRACSQCHGADKMLPTHGDVEFQQPEHLVTIELRFIEQPEAVTAAARRKGWRYRSYKGRHAQWRWICRPCLIRADDMGRDAERVRQAHLKVEAESRGGSNLYAMYNEDYV